MEKGPVNNKLPILNITRKRYADFRPTLACEKLAELHDVYLSKEIVRSLMLKAGLWSPRKLRAPKSGIMRMGEKNPN
ncbi:hypothetical protein EV102420_09_02170 [Pseudescherichia vulneris NBRC 102420]|uniref:Transposase n=1 Tax=Pseudescherichia vulneris NBRC 102420 TaxID=1115515 RepID=A0A090V4I9_PSEVU|nr:hypothetical protein EV102420_09_02170 [Pseudescherichia vulneris NBRC 102420]